MDLCTLRAQNRVHAELLRLAHASNIKDNTAMFLAIPIYGDIASRFSTTRETVTRVLSDLTREGVLNLKILLEMVKEVQGERY